MSVDKVIQNTNLNPLADASLTPARCGQVSIRWLCRTRKPPAAVGKLSEAESSRDWARDGLVAEIVRKRFRA
jgi:hypothetical protein